MLFSFTALFLNVCACFVCDFTFCVYLVFFNPTCFRVCLSVLHEELCWILSCVMLLLHNAPDLISSHTEMHLLHVLANVSDIY